MARRDNRRLRAVGLPPPLKLRRVRRSLGGVESASALDVVLIAAAVAATFAAVATFPFLNWDDQDVFVRNTALREPGWIAWAFSTTYMEHFQPLAWLAWGALERSAGLSARYAHAFNVMLHAACAGLVYVVALRFNLQRGAAVIAALLFAIHPLRAEPVAWASAMPYALALLFALLSTLAWMNGHLVTALVLFAISLLSRPIALGLPVVWMVLEPAKAGPYKNTEAGRMNMWGLALAGSAALSAAALLAIAAAVVESSARLTATTAEVGVAARLTSAVTAPFIYLWRTVAPMNLTPLDPLSLAPRGDALLFVLGTAGLVVISWAAWRWRTEYPAAAYAWVAYLALLVPATGIVPSGLQATADRYTYLPAVPLAILIAGAIVKHRLTLGAVAVAVSVVLTYRQTSYWRDSITLWTRAVDLDPENDVALYNLGSALADAGRRDEAIARYEQVLRVVPGRPDARKNRDVLRAAGLEEEGNRLAASRDLASAIASYRQAVVLDPARTHSHAALGMALVETGRYGAALPHLQEAVRLGVDDPAVPNALAFALVQSGRIQDARDVLQAAQVRYPGDRNIARNLADLSAVQEQGANRMVRP
jgi:Flp pilus assembly protein TadD